MAGDGDGEFVFGGDDLPEELQDILRNLISRSMLDKGQAHDVVADAVKPSEEQFDLGPGDLVTVAGSESPHTEAKAELVIARILDPKEHQDEFPDWEQRLMNSFVLGTWYSPGQLDGEFGWFPRARLIKLAPEEFDIFMGWVRAGSGPSGEDLPGWLIRRYTAAIRGMNKANGDFMPDPANCEECGSPALILKTTSRTRNVYAVGRFHDREGFSPKDLYSYAQYGSSEKQDSTLECLDCDHTVNVHEMDGDLYLK